MNTSKLVTLCLLTLAAAQFAGCAHFKKSAPDATTPADAAATPAAAPAAASAPAPSAVPTPKAPVMDDTQIVSDPVGAAVSINGSQVGVTPFSTTLDRSQTYTLTVTQAGYDVYTRPIKAESQVFGTQSNRAAFLNFTPKRIPRTISVTLTPVKDYYAEMATIVGVLDNRLRNGQITPEEYKKEIAEVTGKYRQMQ